MAQFDNEEAIAYAFFMIVTLLILGAATWMAMSYGFNLIMTPVNAQIAEGTMSTQTAAPIAFGMQILAAVPVFLLVGVFIWAILASVNKRNSGQ